jgi:hypothetical protein
LSSKKQFVAWIIHISSNSIIPKIDDRMLQWRENCWSIFRFLLCSPLWMYKLKLYKKKTMKKQHTSICMILQTSHTAADLKLARGLHGTR